MIRRVRIHLDSLSGSWPPIKYGTKVVTTEANPEINDWSKEALDSRQWEVKGTAFWVKDNESSEEQRMTEFDKLKEIVESCSGDITKFDGGNKAAGTRIRKAMQDIKNQAQEVRKAVLQKREE